MIVCAAFICSAPAVPAAPPMTPVTGPEQGRGGDKHQRVSVDFDNVDLAVFIKFISEITGTNFVIDEHVRDKVTIISPTKISIDKAYQVFESVLEVYGYTTVAAGDVVKIVKAVDARTKSIETRLADEAATPDDKVVTQIIPLSYADADEVKRLFAPFVAKEGVVLSYDSTNMLVITDVSSNIRRLQRILEAIDVPGHGKHLSVITLDYADAAQLVPLLENLFQNIGGKSGPGATGRMKMVADERVNAIILLASEPETERIKELIDMLDKQVPQGKEKFHVYYLRNAEAEELVTVLQTFPGKKNSSPGAKAPVISEDVSIAADEATNSLIIMADRDDYLILRDIIEKLDIPRSMVYIECLIAEINVDDSLNLGAEWLASGEGSYDDKDGGYGGGFGGGSENGYVNLSRTMASGTFPAGFSLGAFGESIQIGDISFPSLGAVIQVLKKNKDVHILSTPQIMTTDNEEANIIVGKNIPYITRTGTSETETTYSNYEYKDVGITLTIKPQINENRLIRLDLTQEVTRLDVGNTVAAERPATLKRTIKTNVIVHDGHTLVIGGLIDDSLSQVEYRVPFLSAIPGLGWLFKSISDSDSKTNLFVFLTPHVVKTVGEAEDLFETKEDIIESVTDGRIRMYPHKSSPGSKFQPPYGQSFQESAEPQPAEEYPDRTATEPEEKKPAAMDKTLNSTEETSSSAAEVVGEDMLPEEKKGPTGEINEP